MDNNAGRLWMAAKALSGMFEIAMPSQMVFEGTVVEKLAKKLDISEEEAEKWMMNFTPYSTWRKDMLICAVEALCEKEGVGHC